MNNKLRKVNNKNKLIPRLIILFKNTKLIKVILPITFRVFIIRPIVKISSVMTKNIIVVLNFPATFPTNNIPIKAPINPSIKEKIIIKSKFKAILFSFFYQTFFSKQVFVYFISFFVFFNLSNFT